MLSSRYICCCSRLVTSNGPRSLATQATKESKDVFGTLSRSGSAELAVERADRFLPDDPEGYDKEEIDLAPRKNALYYNYEISKYARRGATGIAKALELFHQMKSISRLTPGSNSFSPLIYGCAKAGFTKKAFELYEESRKYMSRPTDAMVTCLINACAESPFPDYGLKRLDWFRQHLKINHNHVLNRIQYNSAIKAYGKLGRLDKASDVIQEMIEQGMTPDTASLNNLLIGCASDKDRGSSIALRVYKRMKYFGLKPDIDTFRLMLRCIRDCNLGSAEDIRKVIGELPAMTTLNQRLAYKQMSKLGKASMSIRERRDQNFDWVPLISDFGDSLAKLIGGDSNINYGQRALGVVQDKRLVVDKEQQANDSSNNALVTMSSHELTLAPPKEMLKLPNLLSDDHLDLVYRVSAIQPEKLAWRGNRIMLFGGISGFLKHMSDEGCKPDAKTFTLLISFIGVRKFEIVEFLRLSRDYSIKRDVLFYDLLLRQFGKFHKPKGKLEIAMYIVDEMLKDNLHPNISTFEALACCCDKSSDAFRLLSDIEKCGFTANDVVINNLFRSALRNNDFQFLNNMVHYGNEQKFQPTRNLVDLLEEKRLYAYNIIMRHESKTLPPSEKPDWLNNEKSIEIYDKFSKFLQIWLKNVDVKEDEHPWSQFNVESRSKRQGFVDLVRKFKNLEKVKQEALEKGKSFGNLLEEAEKLERPSSVANR